LQGLHLGLQGVTVFLMGKRPSQVSPPVGHGLNGRQIEKNRRPVL
jgi:hypothetical protein